MRTLDSHATRTLFIALSIASLTSALLPVVRCRTDLCIPASGQFCWDGARILADYKKVIGYEG